MFIASALQHPNPPCNAGGPTRRVSTIFVDQHKNKWDQVIVYCRLADPGLVAASWHDVDRDGRPPTLEFVDKCLLRDARLYRQCYLKMLSLAPQHRDRILSRADYGYLLFDDQVQLDAWLSSHQLSNKELTNAESLLELPCTWGIVTVEELRSKLASVYE